MTVRLKFIFLLVALALCVALLSGTGGAAAQGANTQYRLVGYYTSYSIYDMKYYVTDIPANLLTHLNYAPIAISPNGQCVSSDEWADKQFPYPGDKQTERLRGNFKQLKLMRNDHPNLKIVMTVGGWDFSKYFSQVAATPQARIRFARSCIVFMRENGFDGIDLDWRYPVGGGKADNLVRPDDKENFAALLADFRGQLDYWAGRDGRPYTLTITAPATRLLYVNFPLEQIVPYIDWINLMSYSFQGSWSDLASHAAPLFGSSRDPRGEEVRRDLNVDGAVRAFLDAGIPANKIVVGVAFYGQAWRITQPNDYFGLYQKTLGIPTGTRPGGLLYYRDLLPLLENLSFTRFFDEETQTPWLYNPARRTVVSYEDPASVRNKAQYVRSMGLGGMMVWELSFDDQRHSLLTAASEVLVSRRAN